MPTPVNAVCVVTIDLREISGIAPGSTAALNTRVDFSPNRILHVEDGGDDYWLTRNIKRVSLATGVGTVALRPNDAGTGYEVQERGFRGARHGYVVVPDAATANYGDLVWVDGTTLDPLTPPSPAWLPALAVESAARTAADTALQAAIDAVEASDVDSVAGLTGTVTDVALKTALLLPTDTVTSLAAKADLVAGVVPTAQLPPLAVNDTFVVATQAAMLALTAQRGDVAVRTDNSRTYILSTDSPGTLADWKQITAAGDVVSVAGKTGTVALVKADVGLASVDDTSDANKPVSTPQQVALDVLRLETRDELALVVDTTNVAVAMAVGAYTGLLGMTIAVPPTTRQVQLEWGGHITVTAAGNGFIGLGVGETTSGSLVEVGIAGRGQAFLAGLYSTFSGSCVGSKPIGPSASWRYYRMLYFLGRDTSSTLAASVAASDAAGGATGNRSLFLRAVAG